MTGFWNRPEETVGVLRDHADADGTRRWLHTGDLGYLDDDGYVFIVDRKKDLIKTSGYPGVAARDRGDARRRIRRSPRSAWPVCPTSAKGEVVKAWVVLRHGPGVDRGRSARLLPRKARAVQSSGTHRIPDRSAEDDGRQGAAAGAAGPA